MKADAINRRKGAQFTPRKSQSVLGRTGRILSSRGSEAAAPTNDFIVLLRVAAPRLPRALVNQMRSAAFAPPQERMVLAGRLMLMHYGPAGFLTLARHPVDTIRAWAAYLIAEATDFSLGEKIALVRTLANDHSAEVRDHAWMALRPAINSNVELAIDLLEAWTVSPSPFLRRFACEATRPLASQGGKIVRLLDRPELGLPVLEPLRADPHKYVQESVANWLTDAAKGQPEWVRALCSRWQRESRASATERICAQAQCGLS